MCVKPAFSNCFFSGGAAGAKKPAQEQNLFLCEGYFCHRIIFQLKKCDVFIESMAAANFSRDVLEMFYGEIPQEENKGLRPPIRPRRRLHFEIVRNNFNQ